MGDVVDIHSGVHHYVNKNTIPVAGDDIKADFLLQVFVSACVNGATWWADRVADTEVTKMSNEEVRACLEEADKYVHMCVALLGFLPKEGPNSRSELIEVLSVLINFIDDLFAISEVAEEALK